MKLRQSGSRRRPYEALALMRSWPTSRQQELRVVFHVVGEAAQRRRGRGQIAQRRVEVGACLAPARRQAPQVVQCFACLLHRLG